MGRHCDFWEKDYTRLSSLLDQYYTSIAIMFKYLSFTSTLYFFLSGFSFTDTDDSWDNREKEGIIFNPI